MNGIGGDKTRFADGSMAMLQNDGGPCGCNCCIEPVVSMQFNQTAGRYNDRSAFANNLQQDSVVQMQNMFQAQAQNALEQTPGTSLVQLLTQVQALLQSIQQ